MDSKSGSPAISPTAFLMPSLARDFPNMPVREAKGAVVYGTDGREYLDFVGGMAACNVGHCHPRVVEAVTEQARKLLHGPVGVLLYEPLVELSERLAGVLPGDIDNLFYGNSGTEAVEAAIKMARYVTQRPGIIAFLGAFHGRTLGSVALTASKARYRRFYEPLPGAVYHAPFPYPYRSRTPEDPEQCVADALAGLEALFRHVVEPESVAAILVEPVQGEGGYIVPPASFLPALREIADRHGILLIFDEIQTGFGRTGKLFAAETFGVQPDIMVLAKGIASGLPLSVTAASRRIAERWEAGSHGTTFGGNPLSCAAALATLDVLEEERLPQHAARIGDHLLKGLNELRGRFEFIGDVRGVGLMIGIELVRSREGKEPYPEACRRVLEGALERGLILYSAGPYDHVVRLIPPLVISQDEADRALAVLEEVFSTVA